MMLTTDCLTWSASGRVLICMHRLACLVTCKIEVGAAIWLANSEDVLADFDDTTYSALLSKHPTPHPSMCIPLPLQTLFPLRYHLRLSWLWSDHFQMGLLVVQTSLSHSTWKDLVQDIQTVEDSPFLNPLTDFCSLVLCGSVPAEVSPFSLV